MANQHTATLQARAAELAIQVANLIRQETELLIIVNDPQCGKPGRGYKAARKAKAALRGKAGPVTRQQRADKFQAALAAHLA